MVLAMVMNNYMMYNQNHRVPLMVLVMMDTYTMMMMVIVALLIVCLEENVSNVCQ
jgi:uncharacterized membrane protein